MAEQNHLANFGIGHYNEQLCEIILNLDNWFRKACCFKKFLIYNSDAIMFCTVEQFSQF